MAVFSVQRQLESLGQVERGFIERQPMDRSPEVQRVPLERAIRVEALKYVLAKMN